MDSVVDLLLTFTILINLTLLGSSRLSVAIRIIGASGFCLGLLPLFMPGHHIFASTLFLVVVSMALKGRVFPWLLFRAMRGADVRHEVEPYVGFSLSIVLGVLTLGLCLWLAPRLYSSPAGEAAATAPGLTLSTALFTVWTGLFLIVARKKALTQVIGYLSLENGVYIFGLVLARDEPFLVEMGILLDVFVAVFVMGITIFHISREFDHMDVDQLSKLKD